MQSKTHKFIKKITVNKFFFVIVDILITILSYYASFYFINSIRALHMPNFFVSIVVPAVVISVVCFVVFRFYSTLLEFAGAYDIVPLFCGIFSSTVIMLSYTKIFVETSFSAGMLLVASSSVLQFVFILLTRFGYRILHTAITVLLKKNSSDLRRTMIIGAGSAGSLILNEALMNDMLNFEPVVFIDDDISKHKRRIRGIPVYGGRESIAEAAEKYNINQIIIALPSASSHDIRDIAELCAQVKAKVKILPPMQQLLSSTAQISRIRDIDIHDFLGREEVKLENGVIAESIEGKTVLITGGGGSIGSEICRQVAKFSPEHLIIFDIYENTSYELQQELSYIYGNSLDLQVIIGSVRDRERLDTVFKTYKPDVVFHAAAHKHVPLMEVSPQEAVKNNVFGTLNVAEMADKHGVSHFILISTDKAVNPTNVMGATKRIAEMIIQYMSQKSKTHFAAVRFGNVLGSHGSVIPLFKHQIETGGPVRVTHPDIVRFFMTIPEAAQLVLQACAISNGGEIFVLDMGDPVKIDDLARKMISLSGYTPDVDIKIEYVGLRPGEKLYEELLLSEEGISATKHKKIYTAKPMVITDEFIKNVKALDKHVLGTADNITTYIEKLIGKKLKHH